MTFDVEIKQWRAVASWTWNAGDDVCGICRNVFDSCSPEAKFPGDDCPVVWGVCSHAFHLPCINQWLSTQPEHRCPFCRQPWEFQSASGDQNETVGSVSPSADEGYEDEDYGGESGGNDIGDDDSMESDESE
eukprot:jgi/Picsp_1/3257/NSC_06097-R1_anaphase promoting complex subunit 11